MRWLQRPTRGKVSGITSLRFRKFSIAVKWQGVGRASRRRHDAGRRVRRDLRCHAEGVGQGWSGRDGRRPQRPAYADRGPGGAPNGALLSACHRTNAAERRSRDARQRIARSHQSRQPVSRNLAVLRPSAVWMSIVCSIIRWVPPRHQDGQRLSPDRPP